MNWPHLEIFWLSIDNSKSIVKRKRTKDRQKKRWEGNIRDGLCKHGQLKTGLGGKGFM